MSDNPWTSERSIKIWNDKTGHHYYVGPDSDGLELVEIKSITPDGKTEASVILPKEAALELAKAIHELYHV